MYLFLFVQKDAITKIVIVIASSQIVSLYTSNMFNKQVSQESKSVTQTLKLDIWLNTSIAHIYFIPRVNIQDSLIAPISTKVMTKLVILLAIALLVTLQLTSYCLLTHLRLSCKGFQNILIFLDYQNAAFLNSLLVLASMLFFELVSLVKRLDFILQYNQLICYQLNAFCKLIHSTSNWCR